MKTLLLLAIGLCDLFSFSTTLGQPLDNAAVTFSSKRIETFSSNPNILLLEVTEASLQHYYLVSLDQEGNVINHVIVGLEGGEETIGSFTYDYDSRAGIFSAMQKFSGPKGNTTFIRIYDVTVTSFPLISKKNIEMG